MPTEDELNAALNSPDGNIPKGEDEPAPEVDDEPVADEPVEEPEAEEPEAEPEPQAAKPQSRAERRIQALAEARARAEAEAQVQRELAERYRLQAEQAANERRRQEDDLLDPTERRLRNAEAMAQQSHMASIDAADKATFTSRAAVDPIRAKYLDRVEAEIAKARQNGQMASREGVYVYLRGQDAVAADGRARAARQKSVEAVNAQRGKPNSPRSDASPRRVQTLEDRLKDVPI